MANIVFTSWDKEKRFTENVVYGPKSADPLKSMGLKVAWVRIDTGLPDILTSDSHNLIKNCHF